MRRWFLLLVLLGLGVGGYFLLRPKRVAQVVEAPEVYTVVRGEVRVTVSGSGSLAPWQTLDVRPEVQGLLRSVVEEGTWVEKGQVLAELDPTSFRQALEEAQADLAKVEAALANTRAQGESALASLKASLKSAEVAYANAQASLSTAQRNLEATRLLYQAGGASQQALLEAEAAYASARRSLENAEVSVRAQQEALALREAQLREDLRIQEAALVQARLAVAESISPQGETVNNIPVFKVAVSLAPDPRFRSGMSADGEIVVREAKDVLVIPKRAVERGQGGAYVTRLLPDGSTERVPVTLGLEDNTRVAVLEGLKEGDQVILSRRGATGSNSQQQRPPEPLPLMGPGR